MNRFDEIAKDLENARMAGQEFYDRVEFKTKEDALGKIPKMDLGWLRRYFKETNSAIEKLALEVQELKEGAEKK